MQYKTIVLHLLEQHPELYNQLRRRHQMLPTLNQYANQLKTLHETWKEILLQGNPGSEASQIASEALEMALNDLEDRLPYASPRDELEVLSLDQAMAYVRNLSSKK